MNIDWEKEAREFLLNNKPVDWAKELASAAGHKIKVKAPEPYVVWGETKVDPRINPEKNALPKYVPFELTKPGGVEIVERYEPPRKVDFAAITALIARGS